MSAAAALIESHWKTFSVAVAVGAAYFLAIIVVDFVGVLEMLGSRPPTSREGLYIFAYTMVGYYLGRRDGLKR